MGVASLVLGIITIICSFIPGINLFGAILGIVGIILGAVGKKNPEKAGVAKAGLVCSIIGLILCIALYVACVACVAGAGALSM